MSWRINGDRLSAISRGFGDREAKKTMLLWLMMNERASRVTAVYVGCNASFVAVEFLVKVMFLASRWIIMSDEGKKNRVEFLHLDGACEDHKYFFESSKRVAWQGWTLFCFCEYASCVSLY